MEPSVVQRVQKLLEAKSVAFKVIEHEPTFTSEQAAAVRGTPLKSGAKALVCKTNSDFQMLVMPASLKLFTRGVRKELGIQRLRFASKEELFELTGLAPGCVPPFGSLFNLPTWCDYRLAEQLRINFNAGDHTISIGIAFDDYNRVESPKLGNIAK